MTTLCEKYRAACFLDVKGQDMAIDKLKLFMKRFPQKKSAILYGPPGTGKTSLAYALAIETGSEILEMNASDLRNKEQLEKVLKPATEQMSLSGKNKIILVDEVDGISTADRGGLPELLSLVDKTHYPIIITANNIWQQKFSLLRQRSEMIQLKNLEYRIILSVLKAVVDKEKIQINSEMLTSIAIKSRGDMRAALNDLQTMFQISKPQEIDERDKEEDIFNILRRIFKEITNHTTLKLYDTVNMPLDEISLWLDENIPSEYKGIELWKAYEALSIADVFKGRIYRQQHWRFLIYQNILLSAGVASAKETARFGFTAYKKPTRILKIWMNNQRNEKKKSISQKYATYCHIGRKRAMKDFPIIKNLLQNKKVHKELKLTEEEAEYLANP